MKTVEKRIRECREEGKIAFIPYIMAGDGGLETLQEKLIFLEECGATAIEIGIPFSDPVADGEVIQQAGERALLNGVTLRKVLEKLEEVKGEVSVPLVIMTYLNPILAIGVASFIKKCEDIGICGLIIPDLPIEENGLLYEQLQGTDIALIPLISLTSSHERIADITANAEGFIYAVTVNGITGVRNSFGSELAEHLKRVKEVSPVPVLAGFGISTPQQVEQLGDHADGVIVGSAIVDAFHRKDLESIRGLLKASDRKFKNIAIP
ncbi:tryptophan synthase subunit alpha [Sporosarcina sp. FSL W8-0480]|uniref:tryptophan synthase subunit alpha n=1 Tax=Sporosarcina sp. FSL W8-0480 TaxID=2954701 RepID=UPI0030DB937C